MKRFILSIFLIVSTIAGTLAETHYKPHISVGVRGGVSLAMMSFSPSVKQKLNTGTTGAISIRYSEEKLFGLVAEVGWVQRGWAENYEELPFRYSRTIDYINIPLLTQIHFGTRRFKGLINLGPQFSFYTGDKIKSNFDYEHPRLVPDFPFSTRMTQQLVEKITGKFDYGICAGIGFEFYVQPRHSIMLEGRYYFGLGNVYPAAKADTFSASRNMSIEVTMGYNFRL